jgi:hypothetical protein
LRLQAASACALSKERERAVDAQRQAPVLPGDASNFSGRNGNDFLDCDLRSPLRAEGLTSSRKRSVSLRSVGLTGQITKEGNSAKMSL